MAGDRHSVAEAADLIADEIEKAEREAENGIRQYQVALKMIRSHVHDVERPFKLRHCDARTARDWAEEHPPVGRHVPKYTGFDRVEQAHAAPSLRVSDEVSDLCEYVNRH